MSFDYQMTADPSNALQASDKVETSLKRVEGQAKKTGSAIDDAYQDKSGRWRDANGRFLTIGQSGAQAGRSISSGMDSAAERAEKAAGAVGKVHSGMMDLIAIGAAYVSGHQLMELTDGYTEIANKIRVVTSTTENFNGVMEETFAIAQATRTGWDDVASVTQRLSQVTKGLGMSQREVLDLTREMTMASKISGATSREAAMSMGEITHAFETGVLQGREYKVLMRDTPALMHELQVASGKTSSEFANMGKHGKITAELLIEWFGKAGPAIEEKFGRMVPTMSENLTLLRNAAEKFFGETATGTGVLSTLSNAVKFIVAHFETFAKVALGVGEALIGLYVLEKVITLVKLLSAAVLANPIGALITALVIGISVVRQFGDEFQLSGVKVGTILREVWTDLKELGKEIWHFINDAWSGLTKAFSDGFGESTGGIKMDLRNILLLLASFVDAAIGMVVYLKDTFVTIFTKVPAAIGELFIDVARKISTTFGAVINKLIDGYNYIHGKLDSVGAASGVGVKEGMAARDQTEKENVDALRAALEAERQSHLKITGFKSAEIEPYESEILKKLAAARQAERARMIAEHGPGAPLASVGITTTSGTVDDMVKQAGPLRDDKERALLGLGHGKTFGEAQAEAQGYLGHVNFDFSNVLAGSEGELVEKLKSDIKKAVTTDHARSYITDLFDRAAIADMTDPGQKKKAATIDTSHSEKEAAEATDAQKRAYAKLLAELEEVRKQSNPMVEAQEKIKHAEDVTTRAVEAKMITYTEAGRIVDDMTEKLRDQLDPLGKVQRELIEETALLAKTDEARAHEAEMTKINNELHKAGKDLTVSEIASLERMLTMKEKLSKQYKEEHALLEQINGPLKKYRETMEALEGIKDRISPRDYQKVKEQAQDALDEATGRSREMTAGISKGLRGLRDEIRDIGSSTAAFIKDTFSQVNDFIISAAQTGEFSWRKLLSTIESGLLKLALQMLEMGLVDAIAPEASSALKLGHEGLHAADGGGHAGGGSYTVGGSGGPDSQRVMFRLTPGERVDFTPPGGSAARGAQRTVVHMHYDKREITEGMSGDDGDRVQHSFIRRNRGSLRAQIGR